MFYTTDAASYSPTSGAPDKFDGEDEAAPLALGNTLPSALINAGLLGSNFAPLNHPGSPYDGMLFFQRRAGHRIAVIARETLLGNHQFGGTMYAKWGHVIVAGTGTFRNCFVVGSLRFVNVLNCSISPGDLLPPAKDVFLVQ